MQAVQNLNLPAQEAITAAIHEARRGRALGACAKSSRGAAVYSRALGVYGVGYNGPPYPFRCTKSPTCRARCNQICEHAEQRAIRAAMKLWTAPQVIPLEIVHVKINEHGELVGGGKPSCVVCSREILDAGLSMMWLYERKWVSCRPGLECPYCTGESCRECEIAGACGNPRNQCAPDHDRHYGLREEDPRWTRYTAERFHEATLRTLGLWEAP
jgi:deoxycytidylate deaminase